MVSSFDDDGADVSSEQEGSGSSEPLLAAAELGELDRLRRHLALRTATDGHGSQTSRRRGQSPEFVDHRPYGPGDDLRRLDWNVLARSNVTVIKRYRAEEESAVRIVIDVSGSMGAGVPSKLTLAKRIGAAVGYIALADGERAQVATLSARGVVVFPPKRGRGQYGAIQALIERTRADLPLRSGATASASNDHGASTAASKANATNAPEAMVTELLSRIGRAGVLVVISDALAANGDLDAWPRAIGRARASGHDLRLVQILSPQDIDPPWDGDLELFDVETGDAVDVTFDLRAREAYAQRLEGLVNGLREGCRRAKATYTRAVSDDGVIPVMRRLSSGGID
ncbi:MAG: DUF58 domain-containing protein [Polyangiales bacterium]